MRNLKTKTICGDNYQIKKNFIHSHCSILSLSKIIYKDAKYAFAKRDVIVYA